MLKTIGIRKRFISLFVLLLIAGGSIFVYAEGPHKINEAGAREIALKDAGVSEKDAVFKKIELEREKGISGYKLNFLAKGYSYFYFIDADTGSIFKRDKDLSGKNRSMNSGTSLTVEEAKAIASKHSGISENNIDFKDIDRKDKEGKVVYELEFESRGYEYKYLIDADDGSVIESKMEKH